MIIITSLLSVTSDLLVTRRINPRLMPDRCSFDQGLVMDWDNLTWPIPPLNGYPALIASNAQIPRSEDFYHCLVGIYKKVPSWDDPSFCATDEDIMGGWDCVDVNNNYVWQAAIDIQAIGDWLTKDNLQYSNWSVNQDFDAAGDTTHAVFWSSSAQDNSHSAFEVRVSVDMNASYSDDKTFKSYQCSLIPSTPAYIDPLTKILSRIPSNLALYRWADGLTGVVYRGDGSSASIKYLKSELEQYLNTLTMGVGGSNNVFKTPFAEDSSFYGCLTYQALVHPIIPVLIAFTGFIFLVTLIYYLMLQTRLSTHFWITRLGRNPNANTAPNIKPVPDSTLSWILQAARENALEAEHLSTSYRGAMSPTITEVSNQSIGVPSKERELRDWRFEVVDMPNGVARVVKRHGKIVSPVMSSSQPQQQEMEYGQNVYGTNGHGQQNLGLGMQQQQEGGYGQNAYGPNVYGQQYGLSGI